MDLKQTVSKVARLVGYKAKHSHTYEEVEREFLQHHPQADVAYLREAHAFGTKCHEGQFRKSGEPYMTHPTSVGFLLAESKLDMVTIAAGFLHDVMEDCDVSFEDLEQKFGKDLADIVDGVTKIGKVRFRDKLQAQAENYRKMILAMANDVRVLIVKLADRSHNMLTLDSLPEEKRHRISQETLDIFVPLAHRIGMSHFRNELERLAFFYLEPDAYKELDQLILDRERVNHGFMARTTNDIDQLLLENQVEAETSSRIKSHYSIYKKMNTKKCTLNGLYDYYAFRIITQSVLDCYKVFGLLHGRWRHVPHRIKDFIATPKTNLYQSIHTTLISDDGTLFEVQVRTKTMHRLAEEGVAAHWTYKNGRLLHVGRNDFVNWLRRVADDQKEVEDTDELLATIKGQLQTKDILVFTPNSEIKTLPQGSTPLDFAYLIHTEVGNHAVAAKVDGKMVSLKSELSSGSIVEIITKNTQKPNEEWLKIVKTPSARAKIRSWLRKEELSKAIEMGKTIFEQELKRNKVPLKEITRDALTAQLHQFDKKKIDDFYAAIGYGTITPRKAVWPFVSHKVEDTEREEKLENRLARAIQKFSGKSKSMVMVKGHNDVLVSLCKGCNPILGDDIVGYITLGRGISVHKRDCQGFNQRNLAPERKIAVGWDMDGEPHYFSVQLKVYTEDRAGMIADISNALAETKTNVLNLRAQVNQERGVGIFDIVVQISDLGHLNKVTRGFKKVKGFLSCERMK